MSCTAIVRDSNDVSIIDLSGRMMHPDGPEAVRDAIKRELDRGRRKILLNLDAVDYIDSMGLGALANSFITIQRMGGELKLLHTHSHVNSMLQVTKLYKVFVTFTDEGDAVASFA
jgi:anti-anti-sigma factor